MPFDCLKDGCGKGECCGCIPISKRVFEKNQSKLQTLNFEMHNFDGDNVIAQTKNGVCVFLNRTDKKCEIYGDRPEVCILYGIHPALPCPYLKADGSKRTGEETLVIEKEIDDDIMKVLEQFKPLRNAMKKH